METTLMIVTVIALALALGMTVVAWRLLRDNKTRSAARADVLRALADEGPDDDEDNDAAPVGPGSGVPGFRSSEVLVPRFRSSEVPVPRFTDIEPVTPRTRTPERRNPGTPEPAPAAADWDIEIAAPAPAFAATVAAPAAPQRRWLALAGVGVVMAGLISGVYTVYRPVIAAESSDSGGVSQPAAASPIARSGAPRPIELLSLSHRAENDGTFTITGLVQNPVDGAPVRKVMAVAYLFDREGNYFASGKAALDFTMLQPGEESPFVIRVPGVSRVSRYRVGFRSEEGGIVAHVDRRGQLPGGTTGDAIDTPLRSSTRRSN